MPLNCQFNELAVVGPVDIFGADLIEHVAE